MRTCPAHFVLFKHDKPNAFGQIYEPYKCYDEDMIWDSPGYEVLGFFDTLAEARDAIKQDKASK